MMHAEVLPATQQSCLRKLGPVLDQLGFYLGGGTAVAIHLGHRQSIDFDWFTEAFPMEPVELAGALVGRGVGLQVSSLALRTLHGEAAGVRVTFLEFRLPLLAPTESWPEYDCRVASLEDLAAMKLLAVAQRGTKKDFIDVHAIGAVFGVETMLDLYRRKFSVTDVGRVVAALTYFDDADLEPMPVMLDGPSWETVKAGVRNMVRRFAAR